MARHSPVVCAHHGSGEVAQLRELPAWVTEATARVGVGRSAWQALPPRLRDELHEARRTGLVEPAELGLRWA